MSQERKTVVLFDATTPGAAGATRGDVVHVDGRLVSVGWQNDALGAAGELNILTGPGKAEVNQFVMGEDPGGIADIATVSLVAAAADSRRVVYADKWVQVSVTHGASAGRTRVTGIVAIDQD